MKYSLLLVPASALALLGACTYGDYDDSDRGRTVHYAPSPAIEDAQSRLQSLGFYNGPVDGLMGPDTRDAVGRFQRDRGLTITLRLDDATLSALHYAQASAAPQQPTATLSAADIRSLQSKLARLGYYNGPADGMWGADTQAAMERFQRDRRIDNVGRVTPATWEALDAAANAPARGRQAILEPSVVRGVQARLARLGFYHSDPDGVWGPTTEDALKQFQQSRGLDVTGDLTPATASMLGLNPNNLRSSTAAYRR